jgi:hypothetical protein
MNLFGPNINSLSSMTQKSGASGSTTASQRVKK